MKVVKICELRKGADVNVYPESKKRLIVDIT